jgi:hypothetical protein
VNSLLCGCRTITTFVGYKIPQNVLVALLSVSVQAEILKQIYK